MIARKSRRGKAPFQDAEMRAEFKRPLGIYHFADGQKLFSLRKLKHQSSPGAGRENQGGWRPLTTP